MTNSKNILLVEDSGNWQDTLSRLLEGKGYKVEVLSGYSAAVKRILLAKSASRHAPLSLCVIDLDLRGTEDKHNLDGSGLVAMCVQLHIPTIIISDYLIEANERLLSPRKVIGAFRKENFDELAFLGVVEDEIQKPRQSGGTTRRSTPTSIPDQAIPQHSQSIDTGATLVLPVNVRTTFEIKLGTLLSEIDRYYESALELISKRHQNNRAVLGANWSPSDYEQDVQELDQKRQTFVARIQLAHTVEELSSFFPELLFTCHDWGKS
jgi:CheY-like chemotaxis protein